MKIIFEMDSSLVVNLVTNGCSKLHYYSLMMDAIRGLMKKDWQIKIQHCYKEANMVADKLANAVHVLENQDEDLNVFHLSLFVCKKQLEWDI